MIHKLTDTRLIYVLHDALRYSIYLLDNWKSGLVSPLGLNKPPASGAAQNRLVICLPSSDSRSHSPKIGARESSPRSLRRLWLAKTV
jgi:hypothetical protein